MKSSISLAGFTFTKPKGMPTHDPTMIYGPPPLSWDHEQSSLWLLFDQHPGWIQRKGKRLAIDWELVDELWGGGENTAIHALSYLGVICEPKVGAWALIAGFESEKSELEGDQARFLGFEWKPDLVLPDFGCFTSRDYALDYLSKVSGSTQCCLVQIERIPRERKRRGTRRGRNG